MLHSLMALGLKSSLTEEGLKAPRVGGHKMWEEVMEGCFDHEPITHHFVLKEAWNLHN